MFGYASALVDGGQIAYVGPLTTGVQWEELWQMASRCCRESADDTEKARWIITQATRAFIMSADVIAKLPKADWQMEDGGRRLDVWDWSNHDVLITGNMTVPDLMPEQVSMQHTYYSHYFDG
ncbi:hypothetical protein T261_4738 [Streptomyces lydicus]|nr:hypothetical protein T261_4738 [Streptomyces lydicus]